MNNFLLHYKNVTRKILLDKHLYKNINQIPNIKKITIQTRINNINANKKSILKKIAELKQIGNKTPTPIKSNKSIAAFRLKKGNLLSIKIDIYPKQINKILNTLHPWINQTNLHKKKVNRNTFSSTIKNIEKYPIIEKIEAIKENNTNILMQIHSTTNTAQENITLLSSSNIKLKKEPQHS